MVSVPASGPSPTGRVRISAWEGLPTVRSERRQIRTVILINNKALAPVGCKMKKKKRSCVYCSVKQKKPSDLL